MAGDRQYYSEQAATDGGAGQFAARRGGFYPPYSGVSAGSTLLGHGQHGDQYAVDLAAA